MGKGTGNNVRHDEPIGEKVGDESRGENQKKNASRIMGRIREGKGTLDR